MSSLASHVHAESPLISFCDKADLPFPQEYAASTIAAFTLQLSQHS